MENIKHIKPGDWLYINSCLHVSHGIDDIHGGLAQVKQVTPDGMVEFEKFKDEFFGLAGLLAEQDQLKNEFAEQPAHYHPDFRKEFNEETAWVPWYVGDQSYLANIPKTCRTYLIERAQELVRQNIKGHRKGIPNEPASLHSFRVQEILKNSGCPFSVQLAGLLHDIVEDGGMTLEELRQEGFDEGIVDLVRLCTHDATIANKDLRWFVMLITLIKTNNADAWRIKLADILDNLNSHGLSPERAHYMREVKAPVLLESTKDILAEDPIRKELMKFTKK
jgi:hypothetical protein